MNGEARAALLQRLGEQAPGQAAQLRDMLASDDEDSLTGIVGSAVNEVGSAGGRQREGQTFGSYRIVEHLARGGMGDVYAAVRSDGTFEQRVAIKLIGSAALMPDAVERFHRERQILATLQHPNVAQILDAGTSEDGVAYLVMEYVDGIQVDEFCRSLPIEQRLVLFRKICAAVGFAHQNLVVHRDLKPSNILVTPDGTPKLLDFGIAKLIAAEEDESLTTAMGTRIMTADYASPEQLLGRPITTSCDVYSLGVVLYEMLAGRKPYDLDQKSPGEIEAVICAGDPPRPSVVAQSPSGASLRGGFPGDLDNIVLKAMQVELTDRYQSVEQLAADIDRFLAGLPVVAKGRGFTYRVGKFIRRNRIPVAAAAVLAVGVVGAVAYHIEQISAERDRAQLEGAKAAAVSEFMQDIFRVVNPDQSLGETITARDVLDRGASRLDSALIEHQEVRGELMKTVGSVYGYLGLHDDAIVNLDKAVKELETTGDIDSLADGLTALAQVHRVKGDLENTRETLARASALAARGGVGDRTLITLLYEQGELALYEGDYEASLEFHTRSHDLHDRSDLQDPFFESANLSSIGQSMHFLGRLDEGEAYMRRALDALDPLRPSIRRTGCGRSTISQHSCTRWGGMPRPSRCTSRPTGASARSWVKTFRNGMRPSPISAASIRTWDSGPKPSNTCLKPWITPNDCTASDISSRRTTKTIWRTCIACVGTCKLP